MCGIVGIISRAATRPAPAEGDVLGALDRAIELIGRPDPDPSAAAEAAGVANGLLSGVPGMLALLGRLEFTAAK